MVRDETTLKASTYANRLPEDLSGRHVFVLDPMLATGGSAIKTIDALKAAGVHKISFVCILAAPEGVEKVFQAHPDVPVFSAKLDLKLNKKGYICPGVGDAGDRIFGTK